jgi:hypothetical protein
VLPKGFTRIRHYGFLGNAMRKSNIPLIRNLKRAGIGLLLLLMGMVLITFATQSYWFPLSGTWHSAGTLHIDGEPMVTE